MTEQMQNVIEDPWESAENPQLRQAEYWGLCNIDMYYAILQKDVGKVPFNPKEHSLDRRVTAIDIVIIPLPEHNASFEISRSMIAESKDWASVVLPSIKELGISPREINNKYVHVRFKPTGRTYINTNGETKESTTFEFVNVFPDEETCRADFLAHKNNQTDTKVDRTTNSNCADKKRATAFAFLRPIVENAARGQTNRDVIHRTVAENISRFPVVAEFFTGDSPEVTTLIDEFMKKGLKNEN